MSKITELTPYDEALIKIGLFFGKFPHEIEECVPEIWIPKLMEYIKKYGDTREHIIRQLAVLTYAFVGANGGKNGKPDDYLPTEWRVLAEKQKWDHLKEKYGYTQQDVKVANNLIKLLRTKKPLPSKMTRDDAITAIEKVYGKNHPF